MTNEEHKKEHEDWIHYRIDDEPESTLAKKLTPTQIMSDAGIDTKTNYLEQLLPDHKTISYKDDPGVEIEMRDGMRFITKPIGPMPVS
jgi:hypothetical protein